MRIFHSKYANIAQIRMLYMSLTLAYACLIFQYHMQVYSSLLRRSPMSYHQGMHVLKHDNKDLGLTS